MGTEVTAFDTYLKEHLRRDILFRALIWFAIAGLTARLANRQTGVEYLGRVANAVLPVLTQVMWASMALALIAMLLKDLEHVSPQWWGQRSKLGRLGGVVRRLASDLTLWVVGAFVTLLSAILTAAADVYFEKAGAQALVGLTAVWGACLFGMGSLGGLNVMVRRDKPPFATSKGFDGMTSAWHVLALYTALLAFPAIASRW